MKNNNIYENYLQLTKNYEHYLQKKIPLCAAETHCSDAVRAALSSSFEGKYCMNNLGYNMQLDFVGSQYIHELFELLSRQCEKTFGSKYADARTLSGMNCMSIVINSLLQKGNRVLLSSPAQGGHPSIPLLLSLANITYDEIPYDYDNFDINYTRLNELLISKHYDGIIFAQSDILKPADVSKIKDQNILIIYDATQTYGMIAAHIHKNPLDYHENLVLIGGTHKTISGPTCGLILLRNESLISRIDPKISPSFLRNVQPNAIAGVLIALIEQERFGKQYQKTTIENANYLGEMLARYGFIVAKLSPKVYTNTHQIFILTDERMKNTIVNNAHKYAVTLNGKEKRLFKGNGIRIGTQEVTLYGWSKEEMKITAELISALSETGVKDCKIIPLLNKLAHKKQRVFQL